MIRIKEEHWMWEHLQNSIKPVVLYGMGNGADKILAVCQQKNIPVAGVFASDEFCRAHTYRGFTVTSYTQAKAAFDAMAVLLCFGTGRTDVLANIEKIAAEQELFAPDVPVYGDGLFDREHWSLYKEAYEEVFTMLEDDASRHTFQNLLEYRKSGKTQYLRDCALPVEEAYTSILQLGDTEVYLDGGAYTGDTVLQFLSHVRSYEAIFAIEPDARNFAKLVQNTSSLKKTKCLQVCLQSAAGEIPFAPRAGRHASVDVANGKMIFADSIDDILNDGKVTYIKLDVEGQEEKAILGAVKTIANYKPKMQIAAYHRTNDLFAIPQMVKKVRPDYKVYLRHNHCVPAWDTCYYFV
jgi:FkbM family methyltransferase